MSTDSSISRFRHPDAVDDPLTTVLRDGARRLLAEAIEAEADAFLASMRAERLETVALVSCVTAMARSGRSRLGSVRGGPKKSDQGLEWIA